MQMQADLGAPSNPPRVPDITEVVKRVEDWKCAHDVIYRLLTSENDEELYGYVHGLVGGGQEPGALGLLKSRYGDSLDDCASKVLTHVRDTLAHSTHVRASPDTRVACHFLILASLVLEHEFVNYIVLSVHDRDALRAYITQFLAPALSNFLRGVVVRPNRPRGADAFDFLSFVDTCRSQYIIRCKPDVHIHTMPPRNR